MRKTGMRWVLLGGLAGAVLLGGCGRDNPYDDGRSWSLTAQEDYYSERGTGGAGEAPEEVSNRIAGSVEEQEHLWLRQDMRTPYPPPPSQIPLGTGKPLRAGPNGAWVQGTYAVELGARAGLPGGLNPLGGPGSVAPRTQPRPPVDE